MRCTFPTIFFQNLFPTAYYIHFEITGDPCNLADFQQCDLFTNRTIFGSKSNLFHGLPAPANQIEEKYGTNKVILGGNFAVSFCQIPPFQINMDEFNYFVLQFLNYDKVLLAAEQLLADDCLTFDVSLNQMVADSSPNIAAVPHGLESTETKHKQQQQHPNKTKQQTFQDFL